MIGRGLAAGDGEVLGFGGDDVAGGIDEFGGEGAVGAFASGIGNFGGEIDEGVIFADVGLGPVDARGTVIEGGETDLIGGEQMDGAIEAAVDVEIAGQGGDVGLLGVIDAGGDEVLAVGVEGVGDFVAEGAEGAAMFAEIFAVQINFGYLAGGFEPQEIALAGLGLQFEGAAIPAGAAVVGVGDLGLFPAPAVGDGNGLPIVIVEAG